MASTSRDADLRWVLIGDWPEARATTGYRSEFAHLRPNAETGIYYDTTTFVGLDVHTNSIAVACIGTDPDEPGLDVDTIGTQQYTILIGS